MRKYNYHTAHNRLLSVTDVPGTISYAYFEYDERGNLLFKRMRTCTITGMPPTSRLHLSTRLHQPPILLNIHNTYTMVIKVATRVGQYLKNNIKYSQLDISSILAVDASATASQRKIFEDAVIQAERNLTSIVLREAGRSLIININLDRKILTTPDLEKGDTIFLIK